jgi:hypothetical protein
MLCKVEMLASYIVLDYNPSWIILYIVLNINPILDIDLVDYSNGGADFIDGTVSVGVLVVP